MEPTWNVLTLSKTFSIEGLVKIANNDSDAAYDIVEVVFVIMECRLPQSMG